MLKVGLTGSIAVGKSFVCSEFEKLGCYVLDADKTAREVVAAGTDGLAEIVKAFGPEILTPEGELDRPKMAGIVFGDEEKRKLLNSIVHPRVFASQDAWIGEVEKLDPDAIAIIDAALMIESGGYRRFDKLIVVWCESAVQLARLMARDSLSEAEAQKRIAAQMTQDEKKRYADFLIDTSRKYEETREQIRNVFLRLKELL